MNFNSPLYQMAEAIDAFPPYVFKFKHDFKFDTWKHKVDQYLDDVDELTRANNLSDPEADGGTTSVHFNFNNLNAERFSWYGSEDYGKMHKYGLPSQWPELKEFYDHLDHMLGYIQVEWGSRAEWRRFVSENWINRHPKGAWTREHHHQNGAFATVAYLDLPPNSGFLEIKNPLENLKKGETIDGNYWTDERNWGQIECETGDVLVFPGWLSHRTQKNQTDNNRYVLSTNLQFATKVQEGTEIIPPAKREPVAPPWLVGKYEQQQREQKQKEETEASSVDSDIDKP